MVVPMRRASDDSLEVAVADPRKPGLADTLAKASGGRVVFLLLAPASDVRRAIDQSYRAPRGRRASRSATSSSRRAPARPRRQPTELPAVDGTRRWSRSSKLIITQALRDRASDIHIEPQDDRSGSGTASTARCTTCSTLPATMGPAVVSRIKILAGMNIVERRRPQDGQIRTAVDGRGVDIRVSTTAVVGGEKVVMRLLDKSRPLLPAGRARHAAG